MRQTTTMFHLRIQPELLRQLKARARTDGMTVTAWVTLLLRSTLAGLRKDEPSALIAIRTRRSGNAALRKQVEQLEKRFAAVQRIQRGERP